MPFKKNGPGCNCYCGGSIVEWNIGTSSFTNSDGISFNDPSGDGTEPDPVFSGAYTGGLLLSAITGIGSGAEVVGVDADRKRWAVQRSNGEVWTIDRLGEHPEILFGTGADIAGEELSHFKWHHDWGVGVGMDESLNTFSVDSDGNYIQTPYSQPASGGFCADSSGNIYHYKNFGSPNFVRVAQNDIEWSRGITGSAFGDSGFIAYHNGTSLYLFGREGGGEKNGLYQANGLGGLASLVHDWTGVFSAPVNTTKAVYYNTRRNSISGLVIVTTAGNELFFKSNPSASQMVFYANTNFVANAGEVWMVE